AAGSVRDPWATTARARRARRRRARRVAGASARRPRTGTGSGSPASAGASATTSEGVPRALSDSARSTAKVSAPRRRAAVTTWRTTSPSPSARDLTPRVIATGLRHHFPGPRPQARVWRALTSLPRARAEHDGTGRPTGGRGAVGARHGGPRAGRDPRRGGAPPRVPPHARRRAPGRGPRLHGPAPRPPRRRRAHGPARPPPGPRRGGGPA